MTVRLATPEDTVEFGSQLGGSLRAGDLLLLGGPLGAGKTVLARGLATGLGVSGRISSPTFVLARVHPAGTRGIPLVHVDAYRLGGDLSQLEDLDLDTDLERSAVVVEWGEGMAEGLSDDHLLLRMQRYPDETRTVEVVPSGVWCERLADVGLACH